LPGESSILLLKFKWLSESKVEIGSSQTDLRVLSLGLGLAFFNSVFFSGIEDRLKPALLGVGP